MSSRGALRSSRSRPRNAAGGDVVHHHVPGQDLVGLDAHLAGQEAGEATGFGPADGPHRDEVLLAVEQEPSLADLTVEVDRQLRHPQDRSVDPDQAHLDPPLGADGHPAGQAEVAVEPGVDQRAAVDLHAELAPAGPAGVGLRPDPQVRAVGVRPHEPERRRGRGAVRHRPGHERAVPGQEAPRRQPVPGLERVRRREPGRHEPADRLRDGVEGRGGGVDEGEQIACDGLCRRSLGHGGTLSTGFGSTECDRLCSPPSGGRPVGSSDHQTDGPASSRAEAPVHTPGIAHVAHPPSPGSLRPGIRARRLRRRVRRRPPRSAEPRHRREGHHRPRPPRPPWRNRGRGQHRRRRRHPHPGPRPVPPRGGRLRPAARGALRHRHRLPAHRRGHGRRHRGGRQDRRQRGPERPRLAGRAGRGRLARHHGPRRHAGLPAAVHRRAGRRPAPASTSSGRPTWSASGSSARSAATRPTPRAPSTSRASPPGPSSTRGCSPPRSCASSTPTCATSGSRARSPSCTPGSPPTRSRRGRWPTRTATWPTTARSTRSRATATGCGPARRCCAATLFGPDIERIFPICTPGASDSATFDEVLELLHLAGRSLPHAVLMMIPEAWENHDAMDPAKRAFYQFHASLMEPWDGPASVAFTDGTVIGAVLDRNGLRPSRYWVTSDGLVVMASEVGVLDIDPSTVDPQGPAAAGPHVPRRHHAGPHRRRRRDQVRAGRRAPLRGVAARRPRPPRRPARPAPHPLPAQVRGPPPADLRLHDRGAEAPHGADGPHRRWRASARWAPTRRSRCCPPGLGCCSTTSRSSSPRSPTRRSTPSARSWSRASAARSARRATCSTRRRRRAGRSSCPGRSSTTTSWPSSSTPTTTATSRVSRPWWSRACTRWPAAASACATRSARVRREVSDAIEDGARIIVLSDRDSDATWRRSRRCCSPSAVHHHLVRERTRTQVGLVVEAGDAREVHHMALLIGYGAAAINPYMAFETLEAMTARGQLDGGLDDAIRQLHQGRRQGRAQGDVEDGHLDRRVLHRRAGVRGHRARPGAGRRVLHRHHQPARRHRPRRARGRGRGPPPHRLPRPARGAGPPRARGRRRVPVAPRGRVPPLQPRHRVQAPARHPQRPLRGVQGVHRDGRPAGRATWPRCAGCSRSATARARPSRSTRSSRSPRSSSASRPAP